MQHNVTLLLQCFTHHELDDTIDADIALALIDEAGVTETDDAFVFQLTAVLKNYLKPMGVLPSTVDGLASDYARALQGLITTEVQPSEADDDVADEDDVPLAPGLCSMCERSMPLTFHHLIPKKTHKKMMKRFGYTKEELHQRGVLICRPCHSVVHRTYGLETLAMDYNTLDKLLESVVIQRWIEFARRQRSLAKDHAVRNLRYAK